jgi:hypothetical protein
MFSTIVCSEREEALNVHLELSAVNGVVLLESIEINVSTGILIVKATRILCNFVLQQESHELTEYTENEVIGLGDKNC